MNNAQYFINLLKDTDPDSWISNAWTGQEQPQRDVCGQLGSSWSGPNGTGKYTLSRDALDCQALMMRHGFSMNAVNDGRDKAFPQDNPKDRILACLGAIKVKEEECQSKSF